MAADGMTSGFGLIDVPSTDAVTEYGATSASEVRRASITISHTPAIGFATVRLFGLQPCATAGE